MSGNNGCPNDENDYEIGAREERARIVAWMRGVGVGASLSASLLRKAADDIERGEHDRAAPVDTEPEEGGRGTRTVALIERIDRTLAATGDEEGKGGERA